MYDVLGLCLSSVMAFSESSFITYFQTVKGILARVQVFKQMTHSRRKKPTPCALVMQALGMASMDTFSCNRLFSCRMLPSVSKAIYSPFALSWFWNLFAPMVFRVKRETSPTRFAFSDDELWRGAPSSTFKSARGVPFGVHCSKIRRSRVNNLLQSFLD